MSARSRQSCGAVARSGEQGFTLVEVIVALFIFGLLAASGVALLAFSVRAQAAATARLDDLAGERRLAALLTADFAQAVPRVSRDANGNPVAAFEGTSGASPGLVMAYTRSGWSNPDGAPRSNLQRIDIVLENGRLLRRAYTMLDGSVPGVATVLAANLESVQMRYRDKTSWRNDWHDTRADALPRAVELTFKRKGQPALLHAFLVGTAYP